MAATLLAIKRALLPPADSDIDEMGRPTAP